MDLEATVAGVSIRQEDRAEPARRHVVSAHRRPATRAVWCRCLTIGVTARRMFRRATTPTEQRPAPACHDDADARHPRPTAPRHDRSSDHHDRPGRGSHDRAGQRVHRAGGRVRPGRRRRPVPPGLTFAAGGAPGYSRYVFREHSEGVVPTLVEGPLDDTVRCQDEALPCSYLELQELLHESGAPIPPELRDDRRRTRRPRRPARRTQRVRRAASRRRTAHAPTASSATGSRRANMGSHFYQSGLDRRRLLPVAARDPAVRARRRDDAERAGRAVRRRRLERAADEAGRHVVHHPADRDRQRPSRRVRRTARQLAHPLQPVSRQRPGPRHLRPAERVRGSRRQLLRRARLDDPRLGRPGPRQPARRVRHVELVRPAR